MTGVFLPPLKGCLAIQRNANMLKNLKKSAFLQILWVSLQKYSPLSVLRTNFYSSDKLCNTPCIKYLQSFKWALKNSASESNNLLSCLHIHCCLHIQKPVRLTHSILCLQYHNPRFPDCKKVMPVNEETYSSYVDRIRQQSFLFLHRHIDVKRN